MVRRGQTIHSTFYGAISLEGIDVLEAYLLPNRRGIAVYLDRFDTALTLFAGPVTVNFKNYPLGTPPSAVIVRVDQYARQQEFGRLLALNGIIRVPFLVSQTAWAHAFVERVAVRQCQGPQRMH